MKSRLLYGISFFVLCILFLSSCNSTSSTKKGYGYHIYLITHGSNGDPFWNIVKNGAQKASQDMGDTVNYENNPDPSAQAQLINTAINQHADGIIVSLANPAALKLSIEKAEESHIPVITINSGNDDSKGLGAIEHIGQDENIAGKQAGERLKGMNVTHLLCVLSDSGNIGQTKRCQGAEEGLQGRKVDRLQVDIGNIDAAKNAIKARLQSDSSIDSILTLNASIGHIATLAKKELNSQQVVSTFDLSDDVVQDIKQGQLNFAIDQQPYLQGYLSVQFLTLYKDNNNIVGGGSPILTGPSFIDKSNIDELSRLTHKGTR